MQLDLRQFIASAGEIVASHALASGSFRRWNVARPGRERDLGVNPYGCADAANILYTIGNFPSEAPARANWISTLQAMQDARSGLFEEATHHPIHTTAHCIAALELFDARPQYPLHAFDALRDVGALQAFLAALDWGSDPWRASHRGAGLFAALAIVDAVDITWQDAYFSWLWDWTDAETGLLGGRHVAPVEHSGAATLVPHMAGTFHYLFNMEWARRPYRYPARLIDTCLDLLAEDRFPLGRRVSFAEVDWIYCVNRALRHSAHRFDDCHRALERVGRRLVDYLQSLDPETDDALNDLHLLFGTICALAELQQALPGLLRTERPLKLVLDRRPFI
jgi:hypothetical protein